jgi:hypothetical protein
MREAERRPGFQPGNNIAVKVPTHEFSALAAFYRDVLGFEPVDVKGPGTAFRFGDKTLWIDPVAHLSQAEIWLEVCCDDPDQAARWLDQAGVCRCDEIESLPDALRGFWIMAPGNLVHLVCPA